MPPFACSLYFFTDYDGRLMSGGRISRRARALAVPLDMLGPRARPCRLQCCIMISGRLTAIIYYSIVVAGPNFISAIAATRSRHVAGGRDAGWCLAQGGVGWDGRGVAA